MEDKVIQRNNIKILDFSTFENAWNTCVLLSKATFCPAAFKNKPSDILLISQYGFELGMSPMQALNADFQVVKGKITLYGDSLLSLCQAHSSCEWILETFDEETMTATCEVKKKGYPHSQKTTFSKADAIVAGLWGRTSKTGEPMPWTTNPKRMLQMRARSFRLRDDFAFVLKGIKMKEEVDDYVIYENKSYNKNLASSEEIYHLNFLIERLKEANILDDNKIKSWLDGLGEFSIDLMKRDVLLKQIEHIVIKYPFAEEEYNKPSLKIEHNNVIDVCFNNEETKEASING